MSKTEINQLSGEIRYFYWKGKKKKMLIELPGLV